MGGRCRWGLERNPEAELHLPHQAVCFQAGDQPAAAAINATVGIGIDGMIEHVKEFRLELGMNSLRDRKVLEDRHVGQEFSRPGKAVAPSVAELANERIAKRPALQNNQLRKII